VSLNNYKRLCDAFNLFHLSTFDMTENNFIHNKSLNIFSFGRAPVSIEILKEISGITFEEVYANCLSVTFEGLNMKIINLSDLRKTKAASKRPKDRNDLENLPS
jgi:hypothetical protein